MHSSQDPGEVSLPRYALLSQDPGEVSLPRYALLSQDQERCHRLVVSAPQDPGEVSSPRGVLLGYPHSGMSLGYPHSVLPVYPATRTVYYPCTLLLLQ